MFLKPPHRYYTGDQMAGRELRRAERVYSGREQVWIPSMPWTGMDRSEKIYIKKAARSKDKNEEDYFLFGSDSPENWDP